MKTGIIKTGTITLGLIIIFMMGFTQAPVSTNKNEEPIEFRFIGKYINGPLFQLKINNAEADQYLIRIKDGEGSLLYSEMLKGKNVSRKYRVAIEAEELYESFMFDLK